MEREGGKSEALGGIWSQFLMVSLSLKKTEVIKSETTLNRRLGDTAVCGAYFKNFLDSTKGEGSEGLGDMADAAIVIGAAIQ